MSLVLENDVLSGIFIYISLFTFSGLLQYLVDKKKINEQKLDCKKGNNDMQLEID